LLVFRAYPHIPFVSKRPRLSGNKTARRKEAYPRRYGANSSGARIIC
jgi:hypothetical protein